MANRKKPEKDRKGTDLPELTAGPRSATMNDAVDAILGSPDELINAVSDFPDSIKRGEPSSLTQPPTDLEVKTLCVLARVAISPGDRDSILTACLQVSYRNHEIGALTSMFALRADAVDIEHTGLVRIKNQYPELLEWTIEDAIKLGPANRVARCAYFWLTSVNSERAKALAPAILSDPECPRSLVSTCRRAETIDPPLRFEVPTPTLSPAQQENVKRIFPIACRAIFSANMDVATDNIRKLSAEPIEISAPLLVVAARMEGERSQAAAREELRRIAPFVADVLPAEFLYSPPRKEGKPQP